MIEHARNQEGQFFAPPAALERVTFLPKTTFLHINKPLKHYKDRSFSCYYLACVSKSSKRLVSSMRVLLLDNIVSMLGEFVSRYRALK